MNMITPGKLERLSVAAEKNTATKIPYSYLVNSDTVETKSGHLLQTIKLEGLFSETLEDLLIDHEKHLRNNLLMTLSDSSFSIYFHTIRKKEVRRLTGSYRSEFAQQLSDKWQAKLENKKFYANENYITIVKKPPVGKIRRLSDVLRSLSRKFHEESREEYRLKSLSEINKVTDHIISNLGHYNAKKLSIRIKDGSEKQYSEILSFLSKLINLENSEIVPAASDLASYLPHKRIFFDEKMGTIAFRNIINKYTYATILSIKDYTANTQAGKLDDLLDVPAEMIITQSFSFLDKSIARKKIKEQERNQNQSDDGITSENIKINKALDDLGSNVSVSGEHHLSILCHAETLSELESSITVINTTLNQIGFIAIREDKGIKAAYFAMLPGNHAYITRNAIISSENMASLASLHNFAMGKFNGNYWGEAITILETISGTPYYMNFHVLDVANTFMIGPQGSGKTLLEAFLLALSMKYGGRLIIFDIDRGLEIFVRAMNGSYSILKAGERTGFAPFQMEDTLENRYFLINLLKIIAKTNAEFLTDEDDLKLKAAVDGAFKMPKKERILRNIVPFLGMRKAGSLRMRFERWINDGENAWVFDNEVDNLSLDGDIFGFDMTAILSDPIVRTPIYYYLFNRVDKLLDGTKTRIVAPEAWRALQDPIFRAQIKDWSSTPRKKEGFLVLDTQAPEDISQSEIGCKIIQESVTQIYFANPKARYEDYVTNFGLTDKEYEIIKNLEKSSRYFLLKQGKTSVVVRADLSGFNNEIAVLSGRTANNKLLDEIRKQVGDEPQKWLPEFHKKINQTLVN